MKLLLLSIALWSAAALAAAPTAASLRAGAATSNITPPIGTMRVGGFAPYPTVHVHDELVFTERGWHWGPITRTDGIDFSRAITSRRYKFIFNALPDRAFVPVDMVRTPAWHAIVKAGKANRLSPLHRRLLFPESRPVMELFDLEEDPYELNNLAGQPATREIEMQLRIELSNWMVREGDFLPLPSLNYPAYDSGIEGL